MRGGGGGGGGDGTINLRASGEHASYANEFITRNIHRITESMKPNQEVGCERNTEENQKQIRISFRKNFCVYSPFSSFFLASMLARKLPSLFTGTSISTDFVAEPAKSEANARIEATRCGVSNK